MKKIYLVILIALLILGFIFVRRASSKTDNIFVNFETVWNNYERQYSLSTYLFVGYGNIPYNLTVQAPGYPSWTQTQWLAMQGFNFVNYPTALLQISDTSGPWTTVWDSRMAASNCGVANQYTGWPLGPTFAVWYNSDYASVPRLHFQNTSATTITLIYTPTSTGIGIDMGTFGPEIPFLYADPEIYFDGDWAGEMVAYSETGWCGMARYNLSQYQPILPTPTPTETPTQTPTPTITPTETPTQTPTPTITPTPTYSYFYFFPIIMN